MVSSLVILISSSAVILFGYWLFKRRNKKIELDEFSQSDLDNYLQQSLSKSEIGRFYERYIGYLYESQGYEVLYHGALNGLADLGLDLIVSNKKEIFIVQTKCWSQEKIIYEDYIFKFWVATELYKRSIDKDRRKITKPIFYSTTDCSELAKEAAKLLGIKIITKALDRKYPMIKCNVGPNGEKIFHLPFDIFYDKIKIKPREGEFFAKTVNEAVQKGFRRSRR